MPEGGTTGQILAKKSDEDNDTEWVDNVGGSGGDSLPTGSVIGYTGDTIPEGYEETEIVPSGGGVDITEIANLIYPIGRGFIDFTGTDYSNYLGFTWERELVGMTPIGYNPDDTDYATVGATGGKKTLTLKKENLPNYTLYSDKHRHSHPNSLMGNNGIKATAHTSGETNTYYQVGMVSKYTDYTTITVNSGGSDTPIDLRTPYQVVAYWKRIA